MKHLPEIIGHRGARNLCRENTIESFSKAVELGVYGIEFDVRLTKDLVPVVNHDEEIPLASGENLKISEVDYNTLNSIKESAHIPKLFDVLDFLQPHPVQLITEIKKQPIFKNRAPQIICKTLRKFEFKKKPIVSTTSLELTALLAKHEKEMSRAFVITWSFFSFLQAYIFAKVYKLSGLHVQFKGLNSSFINACKRNGLHSFVWTVNRPESIFEACKLGIDGIMTDDILMANRAIEVFKEQR